MSSSAGSTATDADTTVAGDSAGPATPCGDGMLQPGEDCDDHVAGIGLVCNGIALAYP